jgi:hypothetical protein
LPSADDGPVQDRFLAIYEALSERLKAWPIAGSENPCKGKTCRMTRK